MAMAAATATMAWRTDTMLWKRRRRLHVQGLSKTQRPPPSHRTRRVRLGDGELAVFLCHGEKEGHVQGSAERSVFPRQGQAEVVSNSRNEIHKTWAPPL